MEALMKAINDIILSKDSTIAIQKWEIESLKKEIAELKNDIEKYKENEVTLHE